MGSPGVHLYGIAHVKVDFIPLPKRYVTLSLGRSVWTTRFVQCEEKPNTITDNKWQIYNSGDTLSFFLDLRFRSVSLLFTTQLTQLINKNPATLDQDNNTLFFVPSYGLVIMLHFHTIDNCIINLSSKTLISDPYWDILKALPRHFLLKIGIVKMIFWK